MKGTGTLLVGLLLYGSLITRCNATTYRSDGSFANVQALHNAALDGDTILLPAGRFRWKSTVRITKSITVQGAGINSTVVTGNNITLINLETSSSTVAGIHFVLNGTASGNGKMIAANGQNFRIHDNRFENGGPYHMQIAVLCKGSDAIPHPTGVIDHNEFRDSKFLVQGNSQSYWHELSKVGNPDQTGVVYLEDNYFYEGRAGGGFDAADSDDSGRYVFRHNQVHNCQVEMHSNRGFRGGRSCEVYDNTFIRDIAGDQFTAIWMRAGTGVIYNNTITGLFDAPIALDNMRSYQRYDYPPGGCDGTSNWDGNQASGWPCRDQIGRGADQYVWTTPPYPPQAAESLYIWNNTHNGSPAPVHVVHNDNDVKPGGSSADIQAGRDYYLASRPDYFSYVYPHPLTAGKGRAVIGDFNGDGSPDIVVNRIGTGQTAVAYLNNNVCVGAAGSLTIPAGWRLAASADFDRDSHTDYALFNVFNGRTAIAYLSGPVCIGAAFGTTLPRGWDLVASADFNGDSHTDQLLYKTSTGQTAMLFLNNTYVVGGGFGPIVPHDWVIAGVGDFDGDGHPDYCVFKPMTGETAIWYLVNGALLRTDVGPTTPPGLTLVGIADFNGDRSPDYLLYNSHTRETQIWYLNNNVYVNSMPGPTLPPGWTLAPE